MYGQNVVNLDECFTVKDFKKWLKEMPDDGKIVEITTGTSENPEAQIVNLLLIDKKGVVITYST